MIILASASPRRQELLQLITNDFSIITLSTVETGVEQLPCTQAVEELARRKALAVLAQCPTALVIGADTLVALDGTQLGKPSSPADAAKMLKQLSGKTHFVHTGVCIATATKTVVFHCDTQVEFFTLEPQEIEQYVATGEPMDKAGSYGIQEQGALFVKEIKGDYYNVMGLPVSQLNQVLKKEFRDFWIGDNPVTQI